MIQRQLDRSSTSRRAFSLVELLVVIGIASILLGTSIALVGGVMGTNSLDGATNQLSASLNAARAIAMRDGTDTAVFIFLGNDGNTQTRILERGSNNSSILANNSIDAYGYIHFIDLSDRPSDHLPAQILVCSPTFSGGSTSWQTPSPGSTIGYPTTIIAGSNSFSYAQVLWFGADGTSQISSSTGINTILYEPPNTVPQNNATSTVNPYTSQNLWQIGTPVSLITLFDNRQLQSAIGNLPAIDPSGTPENIVISNWITAGTNGANPILANTITYGIRTLSFNHYSGVLVKQWR